MSRFDKLLTAINQLVFLNSQQCVKIHRLVGSAHQRDQCLDKAFGLVLTKSQKKKHSVAQKDRDINKFREAAENLLGLLSPRKSGGSGTRRAAFVERIYKAKMPIGEEVDFRGLQLVRSLYQDALVADYLMADQAGRLLRKRSFSIVEMQRAMGVDFWALKSVLKIYLPMSPFLPEVYRVDWLASQECLDVYTAFFP